MQEGEFKTRPLPVVILSTADIDAPIWTNKQHIATRLVAEREVHYIESLGLRAPRLGLKDLRRIIARVLTILRKEHGHPTINSTGKRCEAVDALHRHVPMVIPFHAFSLVRAFNRWMIKRRILPRLPERYALWSFSPLTYGLEERAAMVVYHSVDLLHTIDGIPREALLQAERQLIARADALVASSTGVADHLRAQHANPMVWENVADIDLFQGMRAPVATRERRAIFVGNLTPSKLNFAIFEAIVSKGVRLALAGPFSIDGTKRDPALTRLLASPLVTYLGTLNQQEMAKEIGRSWVGIIPYHLNQYTTGVFPMKVYEYLAAGLPVVATELPSISDRAIPGVTLASSEGVAEAVARACASEYAPPPGDFSKNSWDSRLEQIRTLLDSNGGQVAEGAL
ncbi:glycosyltransferase [Rhizobium sp. SG570]|uniref:glycosyltransferase n=1 Tax=Rhizobium sp. SG570 TaxID=2587113 RepID=UPI0014456987|nr:glycosyltransferase [Rhizobium sp. SG570]NKJ40318.1 glycosyltransferase involved in cell wall biosynthesis [Rhizobium sp. SG570]